MEHAGYGVFVIDDDTAICQALVAFFTDEGYTLFESPGGVSALEAVEAAGSSAACGEHDPK